MADMTNLKAWPLIFMFLVALLVQAAEGRTIYVKNTGDNFRGKGSSGSPYRTIQKGIDSAVDGDTVLVTDGTYTGDGNRDLDFNGKAITVTSENGAEATIIDCQGREEEPHRGFYFHGGETLLSVVDGFTIKNGYGPVEPFSSSTFSVGGGIYCTNSSPTITNNIITGNTAEYGGGIQCWEYSSPRVINNVITGNSSGEGAGIYCYKYCSATISNNTISENVAGWSGGGVQIDMFSSAKVVNNVIAENSAQRKGGGIYCGNSSPMIINNTLAANISQDEGGGIYIWGNASPMIVNTILWGDSPEEIALGGGGSFTIKYSCVQGGWPGTRNIDADPLFLDAANGDYYLQAGSPCINAGDNSAIPQSMVEDFDGSPRIIDGIVDMGVYEFGTKYSGGTDTYVFLTDQSNVIKTGGIAGVYETYPIQGLFKLKVDANATVASFVYVDAFLLSPVSSSPPQNLGELFNMTELEGIVADDLLIDFRGKTADDTNTDITLKLTFTDDGVRLTGLMIPPPGSADFFIFNLEAFAQKKYSGGTGDPNNPYRISTAEDLILLGESPEDYAYYYKHFILIADIDLDPNLPGGKVFDRAIIGSSPYILFTGVFDDKAVIVPDVNDSALQFEDRSFTGVFDGNGHIISNLTIEGESYLGLFGQLGYRAKVRNLGLDEVYIKGTGNYVGGLAGASEGNILNCFSSGVVTGGEYVGGLAGRNRYGIVKYSYSTAVVNGDSYLGGLLGYNKSHWVVNCYSTGAVSGNEYVGGLVGANGSSYYIISPPEPILPIEPKLPIGPIFPVDPNLSLGPIFPVDPNFFVDPNIIIDPGFDPGFVVSIGGSAGWIKNCYAIGSVTGAKRFGGLVGQNRSGGVTASFWNIETSSLTGSNAGTGKTTAEMQKANTFLNAGWDFVGETHNGIDDIWWIDEGKDYPRLWWEPSSWEQSSYDMLFLVVDDFESYNERIFDFWIDGWGTLTNGSTVSALSHIDPYFNPDLWGFNVPGVHGGEWSMACFYDNTTAKYSEATMALVWSRNWKQDGVGVLSIWFNGDPANAPEPMYVALANTDGSTAVVCHDNPNATQMDTWAEWRIDLQRFAEQGADLTNINTISIGFGDKNNPQPGGSGLVFFDDIRLYRSASQ